MNTITFSQISKDTRIPGPYAEISTEFANRGIFDYPTRILLIGQRLATGSAAALEKKLITSVTGSKDFFGRGSTAALMCEAMLKHDRNIEIRAIAQDDDVAGVAATGSITIAAAPTASGVLNVYIAGKRIRVGAKTADTQATIAASLVSEINAELDLPLTAEIDGVDDTKVNLTAKNKGECGNDNYIFANYYDDERYPAGLTLTVVQMAGGTGNPDITDVIDIVGEEWFTDWCMPYTDAANLSVLDTELDKLFSATQKRDTYVYGAKRATHSGLITFGQTRNCEHMSVFPMPVDAPTPTYITAADLCMNGAYYSNQHPAKPFMTVPMPNTLAPRTRFTTLERELLLQYGLSTWNVNSSGTVMIERLITTYQKTDTGIESTVFLDITAPKTLSHLRYDHNAFLAVRYFENGKIITSDEVASIGGRDDLVSPKTIQASINARQQLWMERGLIKELLDIRVELDADDPTRINSLLVPNMTSPLMIIATKIAPTY